MTEPSRTVRRFFLYDEADQPPPGDGFIHIETIAARSRSRDWEIRPHAHDALCQALLILAGGGRMQADGRVLALPEPGLALVPSGVVHAFEFLPETQGYVLTFGHGALREAAAREKGFLALFQAAARHPLTADEAAVLARRAEGLERELVRVAPGHLVALEALFRMLMVGMLRAVRGRAAADGAGLSPDAALAARFREQIEARLREAWPVERHAAELGVSPGRLRAACAAVAGLSPKALIRQRLLIEAKRSLAYTSLGVAEIAYDLGFEDPAYFSRFFARLAGEPPLRFRRRAAADGAGLTP